jgi:hypothetical protein
MQSKVLQFSDRITALPIIHGSGDFATEVRRWMLEQTFDCVAVPLPPSFQADVERAVTCLPAPLMVTQDESLQDWGSSWSPDNEQEDDSHNRTLSYVPVDPCQGVIAAIRTAIGEHIDRRFIDLETAQFEPCTAVFPDPYALRRVSLERFAAAVLPSIARLPIGQPTDRVAHMAARLHQLEEQYGSILLICSALDWPWIREAYQDRKISQVEHEEVQKTHIYQPQLKSLIFMLGELPFITGLYERARAELESDDNISIDGVKELLISARSGYRSEMGRRARKVTTHALSTCLKYIRNLSLIERRMSPDLYTMVIASKQILGDRYAVHVAETARDYPYHQATDFEEVTLGVDQARLPDGDLVHLVSRLPGPPVSWRSCQLQRRSEKQETDKWRMRWNPFSQCSWPPEDELIEGFRCHLFDRARAVMGADLARSEKFTTSVKDGIDIRETVRNWHSGEIYVKVLPPGRGDLDCVVMLFDSPADPRDYHWRSTWYAEHDQESTLAFFATDFRRELVGPGVGLATYGGAMFLFPPLAIPDIWSDPRLDFTETLEERLLAAAMVHSRCRQIALLSPYPPGAGWRRLARRFRKRLVHLPLGQFSESTVQQLRMVHVLNDRQVRSYAAHFIRKA